jgi:hypothetical protein
VSLAYLVHADVVVVAGVVAEDDAHGLLAALALDADGVAAEELELLHLRAGERGERKGKR